MEDVTTGFADGTTKDNPISVAEMVVEAKHTAVLRNAAGEIKDQANWAYTMFKQQDMVGLGMALERIKTLADFIIDES